MEARLVSTKEAAAYCGLSARWFRVKVSKGIFPSPIKGTRLYDMDMLNACLDRLSGIGQPKAPLSNEADWARKMKKVRKGETQPSRH